MMLTLVLRTAKPMQEKIKQTMQSANNLEHEPKQNMKLQTLPLAG